MGKVTQNNLESIQEVDDENTKGQELISLFSISPVKGVINPGEKCEFKLIFEALKEPGNYAILLQNYIHDIPASALQHFQKRTVNDKIVNCKFKINAKIIPKEFKIIKND